jgi:diaminopimelate decarboxylase
MITKNTIKKFRDIPTPFYFYDLDVLIPTLESLKRESENSGFKVHYAVKANANPRLLELIASYGLGADCVSWNEIDAAIKAGFNSSEIVFAGVGKTDRESSASTANLYPKLR